MNPWFPSALRYGDDLSTLHDRLAGQGIELPKAQSSVAAYVATQREGSLLFVSGQLPRHEGGMLHQGLVGREVSEEQAVACARLCGLHILAQVEKACGLDAVRQCLKLTGYVACGPGFDRQPQVIDGASNLMLDVFGETGRHSRAAVGVASLPAGAPVEIEAVFALF